MIKLLIYWPCLSHTQWCSVWSHCIAAVQEMFERWGWGGLLAQWFPISRSLSTSRRRTDELGSRLERPIHFECKLNEPMHIGMRLLHPAAADHSVSISRQQVQRIFSFSLRSRAVFIILFLTYPSVPSSLWCWCTALQRWWSPVVEWVAHIRLHYPLLCCCDHLPCALQHVKRAKLSLKELHGWNVFLKMCLLKDALPPVCFWVRSLPGAG